MFNNTKEEDEEYNDMLKNYIKENLEVNIDKVEEESDDKKENNKMIDSSNQDIIMNLFTNVTNYDKNKIIKYLEGITTNYDSLKKK